MSSKLMTAALAALMLGGSAVALAGNDGRHSGGDRNGRHERGWDRGPGPAHYYRAPHGHRGWHKPGPSRHFGHHYRHPGYRWGHGHGHPKQHWGHGHYAPHAKRYADYGDDITIIFRGRLD